MNQYILADLHELKGSAFSRLITFKIPRNMDVIVDSLFIKPFEYKPILSQKLLYCNT